MLVKVILVFLGAMAIIGMVGKALFPGPFKRAMRRTLPAGKCETCGRFTFGAGGCDGRGANCRRKG